MCNNEVDQFFKNKTTKTKKDPMQKNKVIFASILMLLGAAVFAVTNLHAAGPPPYTAELSASSGSGIANGSSAVAINIRTVLYRCSIQANNGSPYYVHHTKPGYCEANGYGVTDQTIVQPGMPVSLTVSGSGNTLSSSFVTSDANGNATVTLASSVAEIKTITAYYADLISASGQLNSINVPFVAPAVPAPAPRPVAPSKVTPNLPTPNESTPLPALTTEIRLGDSIIKPEDAVVIKNNEPLVLSGKTVPNGVVTIYVFSEPKKFTTTADKAGNWSYKVSGLPVGSHHIEAEVTDPATGKTSARSQVLAFTVEKAVGQVAKSLKASSNTTNQKGVTSAGSLFGLISAIIGGMLVVASLAIAYVWKFKPATFSRLLRYLHIRHNTPPSLPIV